MAEAKKRLGRGLESLLSSTLAADLEHQRPSVAPLESHAAITSQVMELPLERINRNPYQPRRGWDESKLLQLADSIKANGLIQPILVRPVAQGYQLIAGERRLRAMEIAGKTTIPAIVKDATEEQMLEWALIENIHRADLNPLERAGAYRQYIDSFSLTQQEVAERIGEDRSTIANYLRLLELPGEIRELITQGVLTMGHARALLALPDKASQGDLSRLVVEQKLSVRELERLVRTHLVVKPSQPATVEQDAYIRELEDQWTQALGMRVRIQTTGRQKDRGKIIIEFHGLDDFDRIQEKLLGVDQDRG